MADNSVEILIKFGLDPAKAKEAVRELETLKQKSTEAHREGGRSAEEHEKKIGGLNKALNLLENQFGDIGRIVGFAFKHPIAAATAAAAIGLQQVREQAAKLQAMFASMAESSGAALTNFNGSYREIMLAFIKSNESFTDAQKKLEAQMDAATKKVEAQREASLSLLGARKALELAGATDEAGRKAIEDKYQKLEEETKLRSEQEQISLRELRIQTLKAEQTRQEAEAKRMLHGLSKEAAQVSLADLEKTTLPKLRADQTSAAGELKAFDEALNSPVGQAALLKEFGSFQEVQNARNSIVNRVYQSGRSVRSAENQQTNLTAGLAALAASGTLGGQISTAEAELGAMNTRVTGRAQAAAIIGGGKNAQTVFDAAMGARSIISGGQATPDQAEAINAARGIYGLQGQTNAQLLATLARILDTMEGFSRAIAVANQRLNRLPPTPGS